MTTSMANSLLKTVSVGGRFIMSEAAGSRPRLELEINRS